MDTIRFNLFQSRDTREVTILPRLVGVDLIGRFGDAVTLSEETFREQGLALVRQILELSKTYPYNPSSWTTDNTILWDMYLRKPRSIEIEASPKQPVATIRILHYDNSEMKSPCHFDEESVAIALEGSPEAFAVATSGAFARSKDFVLAKMALRDAASFFCIYRDDRTALYYWFDWVRVAIPDGHANVLTAWGSHRIFDQKRLRMHCRGLTKESLQEFAGRKERGNPNPNPRGSQVEDAGVVDQRRVVVYQRDNPSEAFIRVYNLDSAYQEQVESGIEINIPLDGPEEDFQEVFMKSFDMCAIE